MEGSPSISKSPLLKAAWDDYYASLETARQEVEACPRFDNPAHRAQAYYLLMEAQAMAYNWVLAPRLNNPRIFTHTAWITYLYSLPANCSDFIYSNMPLDGRYRYRLRCRFGDVRMMMLQVFNGPMGIPSAQCTGHYEFLPSQDGEDMVEIVLSADKQEGNWISLDRASRFNMVIFRRVILVGDTDPGDLQIEMLDTYEGYDETSEAAVAERINLATEFQLATVRNYMLNFYDFVSSLSGGKQNAWGVVPGNQMGSIAGSSACTYAFMNVDLEEDEALLIEMTPPRESIYWGYQLYDVWSKSFDFMHRQTDLNMESIHIDGDGKARVVVSLKDPGVANWLDTTGRFQSSMAYRNYRSTDAFDQRTEVVKIADLKDKLPSDTKWVSPQERKTIAAKRRPAILGLYSE